MTEEDLRLVDEMMKGTKEFAKAEALREGNRARTQAVAVFGLVAIIVGVIGLFGLDGLVKSRVRAGITDDLVTEYQKMAERAAGSASDSALEASTAAAEANTSAVNAESERSRAAISAAAVESMKSWTRLGNDKVYTSRAIGINTSNPRAEVHILQDTARPALLVESIVDPAVVGPAVEIRNTTEGPGSILKVVADSDDDASGIHLVFSVRADGIIEGKSGTYHGPSDARLKTDVSEIPDALARVLSLRGVNFRWKNPQAYGGSLQMGLVAQEVEKVFPEVVHTAADKMETKAVEYQYVVAALIEAIKELNGQVQELRERQGQ